MFFLFFLLWICLTPVLYCLGWQTCGFSFMATGVLWCEAGPYREGWSDSLGSDGYVLLVVICVSYTAYK